MRNKLGLSKATPEVSPRMVNYVYKYVLDNVQSLHRMIKSTIEDLKLSYHQLNQIKLKVRIEGNIEYKCCSVKSVDRKNILNHNPNPMKA